MSKSRDEFLSTSKTNEEAQQKTSLAFENKIDILEETVSYERAARTTAGEREHILGEIKEGMKEKAQGQKAIIRIQGRRLKRALLYQEHADGPVLRAVLETVLKEAFNHNIPEGQPHVEVINIESRIEGLSNDFIMEFVINKTGLSKTALRRLYGNTYFNDLNERVHSCDFSDDVAVEGTYLASQKEDDPHVASHFNQLPSLRSYASGSNSGTYLDQPRSEQTIEEYEEKQKEINLTVQNLERHLAAKAKTKIGLHSRIANITIRLNHCQQRNGPAKNSTL